MKAVEKVAEVLCPDVPNLSEATAKGTAWARQLGISHTWLQKLVREFQGDPSQMWRLQERRGDPQSADLSRAREHTEQMEATWGLISVVLHRPVEPARLLGTWHWSDLAQIPKD